MPEGPELHLAARYINTVCEGLVFSGKVEKSEVSKNSEVPFSSQHYRICATSRGKEVKLSLIPIKEEKSSIQGQAQKTREAANEDEPMDIVFRFGMSGCFRLTPTDEVPKHAHLRFYTDEKPARVLCFIDVRRFGSWEIHGAWQPDRGPCVMLEYEKFRDNVTRNLKDKAFDKPICETLLNQKYFNGIGNYLRAEILFRLKIPPFMKARTVLESMGHPEEISELTLSKKLKLKKENPDLLELCNLVPLEVINLGGKGYDPQHSNDYSTFQAWLKCYYVPGMKTLRDSNKRTIWFQGDPGPLAPKGEKKNRKRLPLVKADPDDSPVNVSKPKRKRKSQGSVVKEGSVSSNKGTPKKVISNKAHKSGKVSVSSSRKKRGSVQDSNTPQARGRTQMSRRGSKMVAVKDSPKNTPLIKRRRGQKPSMKEDPATLLEDVSRTLQHEKDLPQQPKSEEEPSPVSKTTPNNSQSLNRRMQQTKEEEPSQHAEDSLQDFQMPQCKTQQPREEEEPMSLTNNPPRDSKVRKGRTWQMKKINEPALLIESSPENFTMTKKRPQQQKNTRASSPLVVDETQNSQFPEKKLLELKEKDPSLISKDFLKDPHPLKGRIRQLKNKEDISPIPEDTLRNAPLVKDKKLKTTVRKRAGSPSGIRRNPRRVKAD